MATPLRDCTCVGVCQGATGLAAGWRCALKAGGSIAPAPLGAERAANPKHSSESTEHMTPADYVEAAREVLGVIELDPASSELANGTVRARRYFTKADDGFAQRWGGRVFLNPPGGLCDEEGREVLPKKEERPSCAESGACGLPAGHRHTGVTSSAKAWWKRLALSYQAGDVDSAIFVGFSIEILQTTQSLDCLTPLHCPFCVPRDRMRFLSVRSGVVRVGAAPTHASIIVFLPPRGVRANKLFERAFSPFGMVRA